MIWLALPLQPRQLEQLRELGADVARRQGHPTAPPTPEATAAALLRALLAGPMPADVLNRITPPTTREGNQ